MFVKALKCKLHRATVTDTKIDYSGSIAVDPELMEAAGMTAYEAVLIANVNNGNRFETYVVPAKRGSGQVIIMGAAARLAQPGDKVIIINFGYFSPEELKNHKPKTLVMGDNNKIQEIV